MTENSSKNDEKPETVETSQPKEKHCKHDHSIISKLFWGLLLIIIGVLALLNNFGIVDTDWSNLFKLWPLFIVSAGLSILSVRNIIWKIVLIILTLIMLFFITWTLIGYYPNVAQLRVKNVSVQSYSNKIEKAEVNINAGAGVIDVDTSDQNEIAKASLESSITELTQTSNVSGNTQTVDLSMEKNDRWLSGNVKNNLTVNLGRNLPIALNMNTGASKMNIDVSKANLTSASIKFGASSMVLKIGDKQISTDIDIEAGASSITIKVPATSGIRLIVYGGLSSKHLSGLNETSENTFESSNYQSSDKKINIVSKIGVSSFSIERY